MQYNDEQFLNSGWPFVTVERRFHAFSRIRTNRILGNKLAKICFQGSWLLSKYFL